MNGLRLQFNFILSRISENSQIRTGGREMDNEGDLLTPC